MKRYRTSMTITLDVWAHNPTEAIGNGANVYWDMPHEWNPSVVMELANTDKTFMPVNEENL